MLRNLALLWTFAPALATSAAIAQAERIETLVAQLGSSQTSEPAAQALVQIGEPAVLALRRALDSDADTATKTAALITLGRMRGDALAAVPDLLLALRNGPDRTNALWALGEVGPYSANRHRLAEQILPMLGPAVRFFDSELTRTLSRLTVDPAASLDELEAELDKGNPHTWEFVAEILGRTHRRDRNAVPILLRILETQTLPQGEPYSYRVPGGRPYRMSFPFGRIPARVQQAAAHALIRIAPERPESIPAYLVLLSGRDADDRRDAVMALGRQGALAAEAVNALRRATRDPDLRIVREAITALGMIGTAAMPAIPTLERLIDHQDEQIYQRARVALRQIRKDTDGG